MKKWTARILAMLMILALVGCGGDSGSTDESGGSDGETLQLTLSLAQDTENPVYLGAVYFADRLKELSGGTIGDYRTPKLLPWEARKRSWRCSHMAIRSRFHFPPVIPSEIHTRHVCCGFLFPV